MSQGSDVPLTRREALARERADAARPASEAPSPKPSLSPPPSPAPRPAPPASRTPVRASTPTPSRHGFAHRILTAGVLVFVGALVIGLSVPANAFYSDSPAQAATAAHATARSDQKTTVDGDGASIPITQSDYTTSTKAQLLAQKYSGGVGGAFTGPVRWPFPYKVAVMSPFGPRGSVAGCPTCAPFHRGVDLNGGNGNPIYSIMDGTVTERSGGSWTYGNYAIVVGHYQGHEVKAIYEHMQVDSSPLVVGQQVKVGDFIGLVGETGEATAPHLHLELDVDGQLIDPIPWLDANAS